MKSRRFNVSVLITIVLVISYSTPTYGQGSKLKDVNVLLYDGSEVSGLLGRLTDSTVQVLGRHKERGFLKVKILPDSSKLNRWLEFNTIQSIRYRRTNAPATGMWVGLATGTIVVLAMGNTREDCEPASFSGAYCEWDEGMDELFRQSLIMVGGAGLGLLVGSIYKEVEINGRGDSFAQFRSTVDPAK